MTQTNALRWPRVLILGIGVEGALVLLALALSAALSLQPWSDSTLTLAVAFSALALTLPMLGALLLLQRLPSTELRQLHDQVQRIVDELFCDSPIWVLLLVSVAAGVGEEWLFRGVLQAWLSDPLGAPIAIVLTSLAFGLAHAISRAYFVVSALAGAYLGIAFWWSGNLWLVVIAHAAYDFVALMYYQRCSGCAHRHYGQNNDHL